MKKNILFINLILVVCALIGCSKSTNNIEYVPCKVEKGEDWSFIDAKGNVYCRDFFKNQPSFVRDGVFTIEEEDGYCLYKFDEKKPTVILEDLKYVGVISNGLMPICKTNGKIEIINKKGETQFTLDRINDKPIVKCYGHFVGNYLVFQDVDELYGAVDRRGNIVLAPEYKALFPLTSEIFIARKDNKTRLVNTKGETLDYWSGEELDNAVYELFDENGQNNYIVLSEDDKVSIYNFKGELLYKCPKRVAYITAIKGKCFTYVSEEGSGAMNLKGDRIVNDKYEQIYIIPNGYLAHRDDNHDYEFIDKKGESVFKIPDMNKMRVIPDFIIVGVDDEDEYVMDKNLHPVNKEAYYYIPENEECMNNVYSDYVDVDYIVEQATNAIDKKLGDLGFMIGTAIREIPYFHNVSEDRFDRFSRSYTAPYATSLLYSTKLKVYFDRVPTVPKYRIEAVEKYSWWYGYYTENEKVLDGYVVDADACIESMIFTIEATKEKQSEIVKKLSASFAKKFTYVSDNSYWINSVKCDISRDEDDINITMIRY